MLQAQVDLRDVEILVAALRVEHRQAAEHLAIAEQAGRGSMLGLLSDQCADLEARLVRWEPIRAQLAANVVGEAAPAAE
jgi:hypothetical protein